MFNALSEENAMSKTQKANAKAQSLTRDEAKARLLKAIGDDAELGECLNVFTKVNTKAVNRKGLEDSMVLMRGSKDPQSVYIAERVDQADGKTVAEAMAKVVNQVHGSYRIADFLYDIARGYLLDPRS